MSSIADIITGAAGRYGLDPQAMLRIAQLESSMDPTARNPNSSAAGLFQQIDSNWQDYGQGRDRLDPYASTDAAGAYLRDVSGHLTSVLGRQPQGWELYMGHQQGPGGAASLFGADPNAPVSSVVGGQAAALNAGGGMTVGDFLGQWQSKYGGVGARPGTTSEAAPEMADVTALQGSLARMFTPPQERNQLRPAGGAPQQQDASRRAGLADLIQY